MIGIHTHSCPHCDFSIPIETRYAHYYTCTSCNKSFIVYNKTSLVTETIIDETETMSPILIGTRGKVNNEQFEITGCVTLFQKKTTINLFSFKWLNQMEGFLLEWDGEYILISDVKEEGNLHLKSTVLGRKVEMLNGDLAHCYSIDTSKCISIKGTGKCVIDKYTDSIMASYFLPNQQLAFCFFNQTSVSLLIGASYSFSDLNLSNTRIINGWYK